MSEHLKKITTLQEAEWYLSYYGDRFELRSDGKINAICDELPLRFILPGALPYDSNGDLFAPGDTTENLPSDHPIYAQLGVDPLCEATLVTGCFHAQGDEVKLEFADPSQATHVALVICWYPERKPTVDDVNHQFDGLTPVWYHRIDRGSDMIGHDIWIFSGKPAMFGGELTRLTMATQRELAAGRVFCELHPKTAPTYRAYMEELAQPLLDGYSDWFSIKFGDEEVVLAIVNSQNGSSTQIGHYRYTLQGAQNLAATVDRQYRQVHKLSSSQPQK